MAFVISLTQVEPVTQFPLEPLLALNTKTLILSIYEKPLGIKILKQAKLDQQAL